jgi:hypothetical protein
MVAVPFAFIRTGDSHFRNVVNVIHSEFVRNNLQDLKCFWIAQPYRFWKSSGHIKLRLETYTCIVEEGETICNDLLDFQFDGVSEAKISFLRTLSELLNRETKKIICVEVASPPSVGKIVFLIH